MSVRPSHLISPTDPEYRRHLKNQLIAQLGPPRGANPNRLPSWLSGDRLSSDFAGFLDQTLEGLATQSQLKTLAVFTPEHHLSPLHALVDVFEQLYPALKHCELEQIHSAGWAAMVKAEIAQSSKRGHTTLVLDQTELVLEDIVSGQQQLEFFRVLTELAESPQISILFVIDRNWLTRCRTVEILEPSLDAVSHVRIPGSDQPLAIRPRRPHGPAPSIHLPIEIPEGGFPKTHTLNDRSQRTMAKMMALTSTLALALIAGVVGFGDQLIDPSSQIFAGFQTLPEPLSPPPGNLIPVSSEAAEPIKVHPDLKLEAFLRELERSEGPDLEFRVEATLRHLQQQFPHHSTKEIDQWLKFARSGRSALASKIGNLACRLSASKHRSDFALRCFVEGARKGCPDGINGAAETHFLNREPELAIDYLRRGVDEFSDPRAIHLLGACYLHGYGVTRDYLRARTLFEIAINEGSGEACQDLGMMEENGLGGRINPAAAAQTFELGAKSGQAYCIGRYAEMLETGSGDIRRNLPQAERWRARLSTVADSEVSAHIRDLKPHFYR